MDLKIIGFHQHTMMLERYIDEKSTNLRFQFFMQMCILISKIKNLEIILIIIRDDRGNIKHTRLSSGLGARQVSIVVIKAKNIATMEYYVRELAEKFLKTEIWKPVIKKIN